MSTFLRPLKKGVGGRVKRNFPFPPQLTDILGRFTTSNVQEIKRGARCPARVYGNSDYILNDRRAVEPLVHTLGNQGEDPKVRGQAAIAFW